MNWFDEIEERMAAYIDATTPEQLRADLEEVRQKRGADADLENSRLRMSGWKACAFHVTPERSTSVQWQEKWVRPDVQSEAEFVGPAANDYSYSLAA